MSINMSKLEKSIGDLSNEEIVNSLLEDFQNDISLNSTEQGDGSIASNINQKHIPDSSNSPNSTSQRSLKEPKIIEIDSNSEEHDENNTENPAKDLSDINQEKDPDDDDDVKDIEDGDNQEVEESIIEDISDNEGMDDSSLSEEEVKKLEQTAVDFKNEGNELFKQNLWTESLAKYNEALRTCPKSCSNTRSVFYANRAAVYEKMDKVELAIASCSRALALNPSYVKVWTRRARLHQNSDKLDEALTDYQKVLELEPTNRDAYYATKTLPQQINERNEKMKDEMLGKLKDLGNMILRPFGLSTNNFQMVQDPQSGGYSINFKQAAPPS